MRWLLFLVGLMVAMSASATASAQSINVDFGADTPPSDSYAAAGRAGRWNLVGVLAPYVRAPLVDITGAATAARIYMYGGTQLLAADDPATSGDAGALMDDMLIGMNDPVDECLWIENLVEDDYEVLIYAMTPIDPARQCRVRVDGGTPDPTYVGGAWPGGQQNGVTYVRFVAHASGAVIAFHSGLYGGYLQSGMNGVQIRRLLTMSVGPAGPTGAGVELGAAPNPSRANESVAFVLPVTAGHGRLELFDAASRLVWADALDAGATARWNGADRNGRRVPAGVLLARWTDLATRVSFTKRIVRLP